MLKWGGRDDSLSQLLIMKNMKKIIIFCVCIVVLIAIFIIGNLKDTTVANGTLVDNGETEVTITITRTNFDKLFNRISKEIIVEGDDILYQYDSDDNRVSEYKGIRIAFITRFEKGDIILGNLYFDNEMKNIVILTTDDEVIYSADEDFIAMVVPDRYRSGS